jgi:hypothetical protein
MVLIGRARGIGRRVAALTGAFAMLVQAVLFGWHHHETPFRQHAASGLILATPTSPAMPVADHHDCQICFALGHHGAVPVDFFAPSLPDQTRLHQPRLMALDAPLARYFFFRSRAPPVA